MFKALTGSELTMASRVLKRIVEEPWFVHTEENEKAAASIIVRTLQSGLTDEEALRLTCAHAMRQQGLTTFEGLPPTDL